MRLSLAECGQLELTATEDRAVRTTLMEIIGHRAARLNGVLAGREAVAV